MKNDILYPLEKGFDAPISQWFGQNRRDYSSYNIIGHDGLDMPDKEGTHILACADGIVIGMRDTIEGASKSPSAQWNYIRVFHPKLKLLSTYGHLKHKGVLVKVGDNVVAGQLIGLMGTTGFSSGNHLHFSIHGTDKDGKIINLDNGYKGALNPFDYLPERPKPTASDSPIIKGKELADWEKDIFEFIAEREAKSNYILKDTKGFISDMTPYKVLALLINSNPQLKEEFALFINKKHGV